MSNSATNKPSFLELLECSEHFRRATGMYIGSREFRHVAYFFRGYGQALKDYQNERQMDFDDFRQWLVVSMDFGYCNTDWASVIATRFGDDLSATDKFIELWITFRKEVELNGIDLIRREYDEYKNRGWQKAPPTAS